MSTSSGRPLKSLLTDRGTVEGSYGGNLAFGCDTAMLVVMQMLIADQNPKTRDTMFSKDFRDFGSSSGKHKAQKFMTCVTYTTFNPKKN